MLELFSKYDSFFDSVKSEEPLVGWENYLRLLFEPYGLNLEMLSKEDFVQNLPLFSLKPAGHLHLEIVLLAKEHQLLHNFFFDLITTGLIEKKTLPVLSSKSVQFFWGEEGYLILIGKVKFSSMLELSMVLENFPDYLKKVKFSAISMHSKTVIPDSLHFAHEIKRSMVLEKFLKFSERINHASQFDAWAFFNDRINQLDFILNYPVESANRISIGLYQHFIHFSNRSGQIFQYHDTKVKILKVQNEFQSEFDDKLVFLLSFNLRNQFEIFDQESFIRFLSFSQDKLCLEKLVEVALSELAGPNFKIYYLEFRIALGHKFEILSYKKMKELVANVCLKSIKQLTLPLFKPRNEEEVMKDFVMLSKQLTHPSDLPQVIVHFDYHDLQNLVFRVILIRVKLDDQINIHEAIANLKQITDVTAERVRNLGMIEKRFPKEACVLTFKIETKHYIREDHTIDFQQARLSIMQHLMKVFGPIRDFEGGMIAKHAEAFEIFQNTVLEKVKVKLVTLENFFYGIYPAEYRSLISIENLMECFLAWKKEKDKKRKESLDSGLFFVGFSSEIAAHKYVEYFQEKAFKIHEGFWLKFNHEGLFWLGAMIKDEDVKKEVNAFFGFTSSNL